MKRFLSVLLAAAFSTGAASAEEITLYDSEGNAAAWIDTSRGNIICLWSGEPVAYLRKDGNIPDIYGFNGRHLGWLDKGIVRDHEGLMAGFTKGSLNKHTEPEHYKPQKYQKPFRAQPEFSPRRPFYRNSFSKTPLSSFLMQGRN